MHLTPAGYPTGAQVLGHQAILQLNCGQGKLTVNTHTLRFLMMFDYSIVHDTVLLLAAN